MVHTFQVTMTGSAVPVLTAGDIFCKTFTFVNNAAAEIDLGDVNLQPIKLAPSGSYYQGWSGPGLLNLSGWYAKGTNTQKLDVIYDTGD